MLLDLLGLESISGDSITYLTLGENNPEELTDYWHGISTLEKELEESSRRISSPYKFIMDLISSSDENSEEEEMVGVTDSLKAGKLAYTVAVDKGKVVGFTRLDLNLGGGNLGHLASVAVKEKYRKLGIASMLLDLSESASKAAGMEAILLSVLSTNKDAFRLYQKKGYDAYSIRMLKKI